MMKKNLFLIIFTVLFLSYGHSQTDKTWSLVNDSNGIKLSKIAGRSDFPEKFKLFKTNFQELRNSISIATKTSGVIVSFPNANGTMERFEIFEHSNFTDELQSQFPEIRAYAGIGLDDKLAQIRISSAPTGIQTMVFRTDKSNEFMEPYSEDKSVFAVYNSSRVKGTLPFTCSTEDKEIFSEGKSKILSTNKANNAVYITMRLALSCTAEYTQAFGGTVAGAQAAMNTTMTRCNGVFEKDLAVHMNMVPNASIIFLDPTTDPYDDGAAGAGGTWNAQLQNTLTANIGEANYDIGHLFGATGGGGNAGCIGCICVDGQKGRGFTSPGSGLPSGDKFDIDYVAHEMGHQMGGNHTFSHSTENNAVNVEPGSGSTIMGYAGITGSTDVQLNSDDYYTYRSILQIQTNLAPRTCMIRTTIAPANFAINAGPSYTIPFGTPFKLTGSGASNVVSYCWEENDDATTVGSAASFPAATKTNGANYRSLKPVAQNFRYFPALTTVLSNSLATTWEATSNVARTLNFTLTGRNNVLGGGQTGTASTAITVSGTVGPFDVTSQAVDGVSWTQGTSETITWTVNGTASLAGSTDVDILLSTDGGLTFSTTLASGVPNNGSATITVPNIAFTNCRVMVKPTGNVYYDINPKPFAIGYVITNTCNTFNFTTPYPILASQPVGNYTIKTLNITSTGSISSVKVFNNLTHTYLSDVQTDISSPAVPNTFVKLFNRSCGNVNGTLNLKFSDGGTAINCAAGGTVATAPLQTVSPGATLSSFNGQNPQGIWTFRVYDNFAPDGGTMNSWGIEVCTQTTVLATENFELADFSLVPNPNNGSFNIKFNSTSSKDISINIFDLRGREIFNKSYQNTGLFDKSLQLGAVQSGVYLVNIQDGDKKVIKKIIVE